MTTPIMTSQEVSELLSISVRTIQRNARDNKIPGAFRMGKLWRFRKGDILAEIELKCQKQQKKTSPYISEPDPLSGIVSSRLARKIASITGCQPGVPARSKPIGSRSVFSTT